mmetsp:Transcript_37270/g.111605  ORF Transcript_37270/g.111605 Transcript_37270/m.111605 type:complete len:272 (+) Transcript_37270:1904-2719(+)
MIEPHHQFPHMRRGGTGSAVRFAALMSEPWGRVVLLVRFGELLADGLSRQGEAARAARGSPRRARSKGAIPAEAVRACASPCPAAHAWRTSMPGILKPFINFGGVGGDNDLTDIRRNKIIVVAVGELLLDCLTGHSQTAGASPRSPRREGSVPPESIVVRTPPRPAAHCRNPTSLIILAVLATFQDNRCSHLHIIVAINVAVAVRLSEFFPHCLRCQGQAAWAARRSPGRPRCEGPLPSKSVGASAATGPAAHLWRSAAVVVIATLLSVLF